MEKETRWKQKKVVEEEIKKSKTKVVSGKQLLLSGKYIEEEVDGDDNNAWDITDLKRRIEDVSQEEIRDANNDSSISTSNDTDDS